MDIDRIEEQLRQEQEIVTRDLAGVQIFLRKLTSAAEVMSQEFDRCDLATQDGITRAIRAQVFRDIALKEIPRMLENIMNVDRPVQHKFSFFDWLKKPISGDAR